MPRAENRIVAVYPGSFDPVTYGHLDMIRRASRLFNELVVGVGYNPDKAEVFTQDERIALLRPHLKRVPNVHVEAYSGLTIDFVHAWNGRVLVRGIRDMSDLGHELQQANVNLAIGHVETVFLMTSDQHVMTSSTYIKQIFEMGGGNSARIERIVPANVARALADKLGRRRNGSRAARSKRGRS